MFPCHACGACCRHAGAALAQAQALPPTHPLAQAAGAFPYAVDANGTCSQLGADNQCQVYERRPAFCDVDRLFDLWQPEGLNRAAWHALNAAACPPA